MIEKETNENLDKSGIEKKNTKEKEEKDQNVILREKIVKFTHMVESVKKDLEKDYDRNKIQKLADIIYGSLVSSGSFKDSFSAMQSLFMKGGSQNSSKDSGFAEAEFIEGKSMKIEDSISTDQNTKDEIIGDYSDPLKSKVDNDQPSTFLNSSSRVSVKTSQDANLIRSSIRKSTWKLNFRKWEYLIFVVAIILAALKITFKSIADQAVVSVYEYAGNVALISNMLRPSSFVYKETIKGWSQTYIPWNHSSLPDKKIFYDDHLDHYRVRLVSQVQNITSFFGDGLSISYTYRKEIEKNDISIFSMALSMMNTYVNVMNIIKSQVSQDEKSFILNYTPQWDQLRDISRDVFKSLYDTYMDQDALRADKLNRILVFIGLNYSMNGLILILMVIGTYYIAYLIDLQLRQAADIFLRIDKWQFNVAIKKFARIGGDPDDRGDLRQMVVDHVKQHTRVMETEANLLGMAPFKASKITKKKKISAKQRRDPEDAIIRNYSHITGFPEKDFKMTAVFVAVIYIVVNLASIINLFISINFYNTLDFSLTTSSNINISSSSFFFLAAIQYRIYIDGMDPRLPTLDPELKRLKLELRQNIERAKNIPDTYFQNVLATTYVCEKQASITNTEGKNLCLKASKTSKDYTVLEALYQVSFEGQMLDQEIERKTLETYKDYFDSTNFLFYDLSTFFLTTTMRIISTDYTSRILPFMTAGKDTNSALMSIFWMSLVFSLFLYHFLWLPYRLRHWTKYEQTLLVLNDDIINCIYIKSYFGSDSAVNN